MYQKLADREWLKTEYIDRLRTVQSLADEVGCNKTTVARTLKKLGIKARIRTSRHAKLNDKDWLRNAYLEDKRSIASLAREIGCTVGPVRDALRALGIKTRGNKAAYEELIRTSPRHGENAANWRGGRKQTGAGYWYVYQPDHPYATKAGYVMEHRLVMEKMIGRYLEPGEVVHHINGKKDNNRPENLELKENGIHISEHFKASHEVTKLRKENEELKTKITELKTQLIQLKALLLDDPRATV